MLMDKILSKNNPKLEMARLFLLIAMSAAGGSVALYWFLGNLPACYIVGSSLLSSTLLLIASRWVKPETLTILLLYFGGTFALNAVPFAIGGLSSFGTCWLLGPPAVAFLLASRIHAFINLGISTATLAAISYLHTQGASLNYFPFPPGTLVYKLVDAYHLFSLMLTIFFVDFVFASKERQLREIAERAKTEAEHQRAKIHALMDSLDEAIVSVAANNDLRVDETYSKNSLTVLDQKAIAGRDITELLQAAFAISDDEASQIRSVLHLALGGDLLNYEINSDHLPQKLNLLRDGHKRHYLLDWVPLKEADAIVSMLISIKDITSYKELEDRNIEQEGQLRVLGQIINAGISDFKIFSHSCEGYLDEGRAVLASPPLTSDGIRALFRHMHTIKGNARGLKLESIVNHAHASEQSYQDILEGKAVADIQKMRDNLNALNTLLSSYNEVVFQLTSSAKDGEDDLFLTEFDRQCQGFDKMQEQEKLVTFADLYLSRNFRTLRALMRRSLASLSHVCEQLGKPYPTLEIVDNGLRFHRGIASSLNDVSMHLLRNCIDHGIETPAERLRKGKQEAGRITLVAAIDRISGDVHIRLRDDGRGLNLPALRKKLNARDHPISEVSDETLAETVFLPGLSTAEVLTDISGRGVGMDAVKDQLEKIGGNIKIAFCGPADLHDFRPFEFVLTLASRHTH